MTTTRAEEEEATTEEAEGMSSREVIIHLLNKKFFGNIVYIKLIKILYYIYCTILSIFI
jgi:hypothetical protein